MGAGSWVTVKLMIRSDWHTASRTEEPDSATAAGEQLRVVGMAKCVTIAGAFTGNLETCRQEGYTAQTVIALMGSDRPAAPKCQTRLLKGPGEP